MNKSTKTELRLLCRHHTFPGHTMTVFVVLPGGVGTCGACNWDRLRGSVVGRLEDGCCLCASWLSTADGSGWSFISPEERARKIPQRWEKFLSVYLSTQRVCAGFLISFKINLPCWAVTGPFSTRCALTSTGVEEAGAGFGMEGGPASLVRLPLLEVANIWLALWPSLDPFSCSVVRRSEDGVGLGAFRDPKPEPRTDDWKDAEDRNKKNKH